MTEEEPKNGGAEKDDAEHRMSEAELTEWRRRQRIRSIALGWALFALAVLFFIVTLVRLGANVVDRPL